LKAGRELDALVAEKVMGWHDPQDPEWNGWKDCGLLIWQDSMIRPRDKPPVNSKAGWMAYGVVDRVPAFSTDIAAAWEVVEKLHQRFPTIHLSLGAPNQRWYCSFFGTVDDKGSALEADTAPLAICLAALKAVS